MTKPKVNKTNNKLRPGKNPGKQSKRRVSRMKVRGKGDYIVDAGQSLGSKIGGWLGNKAGGLISAVVSGQGDYTVKANSLMNQVPDFSNGASVRVMHREFLGDVLATTEFMNRSEEIKVTNSALFPWLSKWAKAFDEVEFNGLIFSFKTTSGNLANTQALGTIIMATQYNPYDVAFANKQDMENYQYSTSTVPSLSVMHPVECDPSMRQQPILSVLPSGTNGDKRFTALGKFNIATVGSYVPAAPNDKVALGELWVTYDVTLNRKAKRALTYQQVITSVAGIDDTHLLGTSSTVSGDSIVSEVFATGKILVPTFLYGRFRVQLLLFDTGAASAASIVATPTGLVVSSSTGGAIWGNFLNTSGETGAIYEDEYMFTGAGDIDFSLSGASGTTWGRSELTITEVPYIL